MEFKLACLGQESSIHHSMENGFGAVFGNSPRDESLLHLLDSELVQLIELNPHATSLVLFDRRRGHVRIHELTMIEPDREIAKAQLLKHVTRRRAQLSLNIHRT